MTREDKEAIAILLSAQYAHQLSAWEIDFLESIQDRTNLSKKQREKLDDIFHDVMISGRGRD